MKKICSLFLVMGVLFFVAKFLGIFEQKTTAEQTGSTQTTETKATSTTTSNRETFKQIKIGKEDTTLYADEELTTRLETINGGELTEYLSEAGDSYQIKTNAGTTGYLAKTAGTVLTQETQSQPTSLSDAVIVLDPGHGGEDVGALSNDEQVEEKTITLSTAKKIKAALEAEGATVYLTHETDDFIQLGEICTFSEEKSADVFISLHADSTEIANEATGITTYYYYERNEELAQTIADGFSELPLNSRGITYGNYQVLRENLQPAILVEMGYMNNDSDLAELVTDDYQEKFAESLTNSLIAYFNE
ncbi:N-acetylmuramoyl-L-alanine amidase family protein [Candidatus Enterococcus courvalinii]|uniref:N-acetylmuramoyl-L-alanine amidase n=1 Tax=Candidatus Enterococcus courvalinii TaxID=2815329 RepID=A0ABS3I1A9_9ENTE|nr:N-acetylmuramoyl-L-alanine amidase [Enterococcus sp. MSG2901]MBO0481561.1 N-acetylmuramoyl-L-alanine amidase [Enterococcus sp. MSG2901]